MDTKVSKLNEGTKYDDGKIRMDLISPYAMFELCRVYTYGIKKYDDHNWRKGIKWSRIIAAVLRHLFSFLVGEWADVESGLPHLAHAAWGCFALLEYSITRKEFDDRYRFDSAAINEMLSVLNFGTNCDKFHLSFGGYGTTDKPNYIRVDSDKEKKE